MSGRGCVHYTLPGLGSTVQPCHVGLGRRFVDKDQSGYVERPLVLVRPPGFAGLLYIRTVLLAGPQGLFW